MSTTVYKSLTWILAALSLVFLALLARSRLELHRIEANIRTAHDFIWSYNSQRDSALKATPSRAAFYLQRLDVSPFNEPSQNIAYEFVERERKRAIKDIIAYLRTNTGKDLGDAAAPWIQEYWEKQAQQ